MIIEDQVISLKISEQLHEVGIPQESLFYTHRKTGKIKYGEPVKGLACLFGIKNSAPEWLSAFTSDEMLQFILVQDDQNSQFKIIKTPAPRNSWEFHYRASKNRYILMANETLANGIGELLIYLVSKNMITI